MIMAFCDVESVKKIMAIIKVIILIIQIVVPILLIVSGMITLTSCIKESSEDAIDKAKKSLINKAIAAVIIFLVPFFVSFIAKIAFPDDSKYKKCLNYSVLINDNSYNKYV